MMKKLTILAILASVSLFGDAAEDYQEQRDNAEDYQDDQWNGYNDTYREIRDAHLCIYEVAAKL